MTANTGPSFPRTTPETEGISSSAILNFINALEEHDFPLDATHSLMLLRHGNVVAEGWWTPYGSTVPHIMYSLSKSFASTAIGLAVNEGLLTVDDSVISFFPDDLPDAISDNLRAMRVRHLLSMNTGQNEDSLVPVFNGGDNWAKAFLALPVEREPGSWFVYNTGATYMLSAILTKLTGQSMLDYLKLRLFDPLGIANPRWEANSQGISLGGTGLHITTEDIARFGQLFLQNGEWHGQRLVPEAWIAEATGVTSDNSNTQTNPDWTQGYGYQFWRGRHSTYRGDGAFGQFCVVVPELDVVLAMTSATRDMQRTLDLVWEHLIPGIHPSPLQPNDEAYANLRDKLANLSLPMPSGESSSPLATTWSGVEVAFNQNALHWDRLSLEFHDDHTTLIAQTPMGARRVQIGHGTWMTGTSDLHVAREQRIAACGAWITPETYEIRACFYEVEFCPVIHVHFSADRFRLDFQPNVGFGPTTMVSLTGTVANPFV